MNVLDLPFNKILLIKKSDVPDTILMLEDRMEYQNHLGTVHASAQYALAEASSGEILERNFGDWKGAYFPVVRRVEAKYKNPAKGRLFSTGFIEQDSAMKAKKELSEKGRTLVDVIVRIVDEENNVTLEGLFTWFIAKNKK
ncbi:putative thioesterase [Candidatus Sulfobium mesophilum]|uniref:Putative thioesterase n=1 Tax=Candidatus Sulfobium mesophilum TaxID=2016548 RepID=A0A2U3QJI7_9BACT|nr:putative thioesterase [Candidatus Sulfobium mesophilum]